MAFHRPSSILAAFLSLSALVPLRGQTPCGAPPSVLQSSAPNIFSEQQEQWLGDAMAEQIESEYRPVKDPQLNAYVATIGNRLLAALPPTKIQFHFLLVESGDVNGFSLAGGRVYLTRKLVASAHNEDEIAGVIAHEMGHILSHQFAVETTADLKRLLGVTSVGDRADVFAKYQRLIDAQEHEKEPQGNADSDDKQDQADRVAVYAAATAGYRPDAYAEFWDRSFFVKGKTGGILSDFFGATTPSQKRLRKIRGIVAELPAVCRQGKENKSETFLAWQDLVLKNQPAALSATASTSEVALDPPLHLDIERLRFSRDGKYVLAQDESSIFVLTSMPFQVLFRFDADGAYPAEFAPDSKTIVFYTPALHVEQWDIATRKLAAAHEIVMEQPCIETVLSPDGRTLACISITEDNNFLDFALLDVDTGAAVFQKKGWFLPPRFFYYGLFSPASQDAGYHLIPYALSADGNTLLIGPGRPRLAFDLRTRTPIKIAGGLKSDEFSSTLAFQGSDKVFAVSPADARDSSIFSFPDGKRIRQVQFSPRVVQSTSGSDLVIAPGSQDFRAALVDLQTVSYVFQTRSPGLDIYGTTIASSLDDGSLILSAAGGSYHLADPRLNLPLSPLARIGNIALSPDAKYLALSTQSRSSIWELTTGKQLLLLRPFTGASWTLDDRLIAQFAKDEKIPAMIAFISPQTKSSIKPDYTLDDQFNLVAGRLMAWKRDDKGKGYTFEARSAVTNAVNWTRHFDAGRPSQTTSVDSRDLILSYFLQSPLGEEKLKTDPALRGQAAAVKEKPSARIIEILNSDDGTTRAQVVLEVPRSYAGVDGFNRVGDLIYLSVGDNRTLVYSLKTGQQLRQFFGFLVASDAASGITCIANRRNEVIVNDATGKELLHLTLEGAIRFAELTGHATQLVVLTADQRVRRFAIPHS